MFGTDLLEGQRAVLGTTAAYGFEHRDCSMPRPAGMPANKELQTDIHLLKVIPAAKVRLFRIKLVIYRMLWSYSNEVKLTIFPGDLSISVQPFSLAVSDTRVQGMFWAKVLVKSLQTYFSLPSGNEVASSKHLKTNSFTLIHTLPQHIDIPHHEDRHLEDAYLQSLCV